jgi:hypothetical protein
MRCDVMIVSVCAMSGVHLIHECDVMIVSVCAMSGVHLTHEYVQTTFDFRSRAKRSA